MMQAYIHNMHIPFTRCLMISSLIMLLCSCASTKREFQVPAPKPALVSEEKAFSDKLQLPFDEKGFDLNVNMAFDEENNLLTLSLTGTRQLMVFRQDLYLKQIFRHTHRRARRLEPSKLPYPVLIQPRLKVTMAKGVWKGFHKKRRNHLFNNWLGSVSPELQPIAPSFRTDDHPEATLIADSVVQRFRVSPDATKASFTLRNILVVDRDGKAVAPMQQKRTPSKRIKYRIVHDKDLNLTYDIQIRRNPCFGQDSVIVATVQRLQQLKRSYTNLHEACPTGIVYSSQEQGVFNQHRQFLLSQFPYIKDSTACETLQQLYDQYNLYVDSITYVPCTYIKPVTVEAETEGRNHVGVKAGSLLDVAHRLDNIAAQIMVARDEVQKHDLIVTGQGIIQTTMQAVQQKGLIDDEQRKAYDMFLKARSYFNSTIIRE